VTAEDVARAIAGERLPLVAVDVAAFDRNLDRMLAVLAARGTPLRLATKSVRVPALLRRALDRGGDAMRGLMCFAADEAEQLAAQGFDDLLIAYPTVQRRHLDAIARMTREGTNVSLAIDDVDAARAMDAAGRAAGVRLRAVLCVDMALEALGGRVHLGVRRSPLHEPEAVLALARAMRAMSGVTVHGLLAYEAQIAGLPDDGPEDAAQRAAKRALRALSARDVRARRAAMVRVLREDGFELAFVNGGGTGSLDMTTPETGVTEVSAGSGLFKPHLFDGYAAPYMKGLEPACFFALEVVRRPSPTHVTCAGGGYVASGRAGRDRLPIPVHPPGLALLGVEGAGEVQTPLQVPEGVRLALGDCVLFRHAKAGEPMERFAETLLVDGDRVVGRAPTYRGMGWTFL
jgi:D-serine deaminase-like pyridoxal phosphate-dependent protein